MAMSMEQFAAELRAFDNRRVIVQRLRRQLSKPLPGVRSKIKASALSILPQRGGLSAWVAAAKVSATVRYTSGRSAGIRIKGSRKSEKNKTDLTKIDRGQVRAPSWGRRGRGDWHTQEVRSGWFTNPVVSSDEWRKAVDDAVDSATAEIRG
jgi:hypothetical protein